MLFLLFFFFQPPPLGGVCCPGVSRFASLHRVSSGFVFFSSFIPFFGANLFRRLLRFASGGLITFLLIVLRKSYYCSAASTCAAGGDHWNTFLGHVTHRSRVHTDTHGKKSARAVKAHSYHYGGSPHYSNVRRQLVWNSTGGLETDRFVYPTRELEQEEAQEQDAKRALQWSIGQE